MEGSSFVPPNRLEESKEFMCTQCGELYLSHGVADGAVELCDRCFEGQFSPATPAHAALLAGEEIDADLVAA